MIVSVALEKSTFKKAPHRFEAGTPNIAGAIGLAAAIDYIEGIGRTAIFEHDSKLTYYAADRLTELPGTRVFGPKKERGALVGFVMHAAHPHDLTTFADQYGLAKIRGTHAIGHVRMATESDVDISGAHPYWAYPFPDVAVVHNGQLTNYFHWRRRLEKSGHRFQSE